MSSTAKRVLTSLPTAIRSEPDFLKPKSPEIETKSLIFALKPCTPNPTVLASIWVAKVYVWSAILKVVSASIVVVALVYWIIVLFAEIPPKPSMPAANWPFVSSKAKLPSVLEIRPKSALLTPTYALPARRAAAASAPIICSSLCVPFVTLENAKVPDTSTKPATSNSILDWTSNNSPCEPSKSSTTSIPGTISAEMACSPAKSNTEPSTELARFTFTTMSLPDMVSGSIPTKPNDVADACKDVHWRASFFASRSVKRPKMKSASFNSRPNWLSVPPLTPAKASTPPPAITNWSTLISLPSASTTVSIALSM